MFDDVIIMAGGSGTRLWPASSSALPKQFLAVPGGGTFFGESVKRAFACGIQGRVIVVAGPSHVAHVVRSCSILEPEERRRVTLLVERRARNTAPAIAAAATYLRLSSGRGRLALVLTSDHVIGPIQRFASDVQAAAELSRDGSLAVFGIPPRGPETGYGYIEAGDNLASSAAPDRCYRVASFREKPDKGTAESFLQAGTFYWNSGMFGFSVDALIQEMRTLAPSVIAPFDTLESPPPGVGSTVDGIEVIDAWTALDEAYDATEAISFDYAVAEKTDRAVVVASSFDWLDIGSWDEYARFMEGGVEMKEKQGGQELLEIQSSGCFVDSDLPVALCGVSDLIVVARTGGDGKPPALLVCKRGESQLVKQAVERLKEAGRKDLL